MGQYTIIKLNRVIYKQENFCLTVSLIWAKSQSKCSYKLGSSGRKRVPFVFDQLNQVT